MSNVDSKTRVSWAATAALVVTFLLGSATGAGVAWWARGNCSQLPPPGPLPLEELDLTEAQAIKVNDIFKRYHPQFDRVFRSTFPQVQMITESLENEVRRVLDDQQRVRFDTLKARRQAFPPPWGPPDTSHSIQGAPIPGSR